ncbi:c-type cytochrome [candidate division KSB1 bacterium]
MYGNGLRPEEYATISERGGVLESAIWVENRTAALNEDVGEDVFRVACRNCHSLSGYKGLRKPLAGLDAAFVGEVIQRLELLRGKMPPFPGSDTERQALALYLVNQTDPAHRLNSGEEVFRKRCSICHTRDREYRGLMPIVRNHTYQSLLRRIPTLGSMQKKMAPWSGTPEEVELLTEYIMSWFDVDTETAIGGQ